MYSCNLTSGSSKQYPPSSPPDVPSNLQTDNYCSPPPIPSRPTVSLPNIQSNRLEFSLQTFRLLQALQACLFLVFLVMQNASWIN